MQAMAAETLRKVKILVLGDTGVGKTSLVHLICHQEVLTNLSWTIGCNVEVKLHDYGLSPSSSSSYFLELWDVGGSPSHKKGRQLFYQNANGLILVHDLTNRKSHSHLSKWLSEFHLSLPSGKSTLHKTDSILKHDLDYDPEQFADQEIPIIIVGTKQDQIAGTVAYTKLTAGSKLTGAACINVDCNNLRQFSVHSQEKIELNNFFDKVLERRYFPTSAVSSYSSHSSTAVHATTDRLRSVSKSTRTATNFM